MSPRSNRASAAATRAATTPRIAASANSGPPSTARLRCAEPPVMPTAAGIRRHPLGSESQTPLDSRVQVGVAAEQGHLDPTLAAVLVHQPGDPEQFRVVERSGSRRGDRYRAAGSSRVRARRARERGRSR